MTRPFALTAPQAASAMGATVRGRVADLRIARGAIDSRTLQPGDLFVAIRGPRHEGHAFLAQAVAGGACGVVVSDPAALTRITDSLAEKVPGIQIVTMSQVMNSISSLAASAKVLSLSIAIIAIIVSAVGVMNAMLMAVFERTQEIGMMRAVGASRLDIFRIVLKEGLLLTITGGVAGIIVSVAGSDLIELFVREVMPYVPSENMVTFDARIAVASMVFALLVGIISGLYPAWKASNKPHRGD